MNGKGQNPSFWTLSDVFFYLDSAFMSFTLYSVIELYVFYALLYVGVTCKMEQNEEVLREKAMRQ